MFLSYEDRLTPQEKTLEESESVDGHTTIKLQKHPGGLFSARVGAWLYKESICCEQQKNVEILMVL